MRMVFGTPAGDSALANLRLAANVDRLVQIQQELDNQAIYIQRPEHEARRPW